MYFVINSIKLFLLISLGLTYLLGQGWLIVGPIFHGSLAGKNSNNSLQQELPLALVGGLIVNYAVTLFIQSLQYSLIVGVILAGIGICSFCLHVLRTRPRPLLSLESIIKVTGIGIYCILFLSPILGEPLVDWDARSIWFFHAKMIYLANSINQSAGWQHPSVTPSHADYPKLVPALSAQVAYIVGFWNEYIPKTSLLFILGPALLWVFSFARRTLSFVILLLLVPFSFDQWIWNGYMDGYLALYFSIAILLLGRAINLSQPIDLVSSVSCLFLVLYIKNEGALAAIASLCSLILVLLLNKNKFAQNILFKHKLKYYLSCIFALSPLLLWSFYKHQWNISNDLGLGTPESFLRIITRVTDGSYKLILLNVWKQIEGALLLLGFLYFTSFISNISNKSLIKASFPAILAAGIYCISMIAIYLLTPYDLVWHLDTSISRTMLPVIGCIFIGCYFILCGIEDHINKEKLLHPGL